MKKVLDSIKPSEAIEGLAFVGLAVLSHREGWGAACTIALVLGSLLTTVSPAARRLIK